VLWYARHKNIPVVDIEVSVGRDAPVEGISSCYDGERRRITQFQSLEQHRVTAVGQYGVRLRRPAKMYMGHIITY
jgi:hypothetical protein